MKKAVDNHISKCYYIQVAWSGKQKATWNHKKNKKKLLTNTWRCDIIKKFAAERTKTYEHW